MADDPVVAPDQRKPANPKAARIGAVSGIVVLLLMLFGNHTGRVEDIFLVGCAALLALILVSDVVLRRYGIKR